MNTRSCVAALLIVLFAGFPVLTQGADSGESLVSGWWWATSCQGGYAKGEKITGSEKIVEVHAGATYYLSIVVTYLPTGSNTTLTTGKSKQQSGDDYNLASWAFEHYDSCGPGASSSVVFQASSGLCTACNMGGLNAHSFGLYVKVPGNVQVGDVAELKLRIRRDNFYSPDAANKTISFKVVSKPNAQASFAINGQSASSLVVDDSERMLLDGSASANVSKYFVSVYESDENWGTHGTESMGYLTAAEIQQIDQLDVRAFAASHGLSMLPGKYYRVKLAVESPWHESVKLVYVQENPNVVRLRHKKSGLCVFGSSTEAGKASSWTCWDDPNMAFVIDNLGTDASGQMRIRLRHRSTQQCLYVDANDNGIVKSWPCWSDPAMVFVVDWNPPTPAREVRLRHEETGRCIFVNGTTNDSGVGSWPCWDDPNMVFVLERYY